MTMRRFLPSDRVREFIAASGQWILMAAGAALAVYFLLNSGSQSGPLAAGALAVLVMGAAITRSTPMAIPLLATPLLLVTERIGLGGLDLSVSDAALAAAFGTAILLGQRPYSPALRSLLVLNLVYQFATLFTVVVNPNPQNTFEWFHAWLLISGALIVGWALGRAGRGRIALLLIVATAALLAGATIVQGILQYSRGDFGAIYPAWPFAMHKNAAGCAMAFAATIAYVNPDWMAWSQRWARPAFWLLVIGTAVTQSRQALIGLIVAVVVVSLRRGARRSWLVLLAIIPGIWLIVVMVIDQIESQNRFNSTFQRLEWGREVYALWKLAPIFGHGLRYWYYHPWANFQPPQAELEVAASAGAVGLVAFVAMWIGILVVLWRVNPAFGTLAFAVVLGRITQAQFDLFWVAMQVSVPFVIVGVCLGAEARSRMAGDPPWLTMGGGRARMQKRVTV